jgi:biotin-(acetyl-CoA carboxylase) ligase
MTRPPLPLADAFRPATWSAAVDGDLRDLSDGALTMLEGASMSSTQDVARRLLPLGATHGTVVVAREQTAGRGRRGRSWLSGPHGLWMSMIVRGSLPMVKAPRLPLIAADAVVEELASRGVAATIKWPNDIMVSDPHAAGPWGPFRKIGGLLLEVVDSGVDPAWGDDGSGDEHRLPGPRGNGVLVLRQAVLGFGLNVRPPAQGFDPSLSSTAGALSDIDAAIARDDDAFHGLRLSLARGFARRWSGALLPTAADDALFTGVRQRLHEHSATLGRRVHVDHVHGLATGLAADGALLVRSDDGVVHVVHAGDVRVDGGKEHAAALTGSAAGPSDNQRR